MPGSMLAGARWITAPVFGAFVALVVQVAVYRALLTVLGPVLEIPSGDAIWASKAVTSFFMGAAFVSAFAWLAPGAKTRATALALLVVALWGGRLIVTGVTDSAWLVLMGTLGIVGGIGAAWAARSTSLGSSER